MRKCFSHFIYSMIKAKARIFSEFFTKHSAYDISGKLFSCININPCRSSTHHCWVRQSSVLGLPLFFLFVNGISEHISFGKPYKFADDRQFVHFFIVQSIEDWTRYDINEVFQITQYWFRNQSLDKLSFYLKLVSHMTYFYLLMGTLFLEWMWFVIWVFTILTLLISPNIFHKMYLGRVFLLILYLELFLSSPCVANSLVF